MWPGGPGERGWHAGPTVVHVWFSATRSQEWLMLSSRLLEQRVVSQRVKIRGPR